MQIVEPGSEPEGDQRVWGQSGPDDSYTDDPEEAELLRLQAIQLLNYVQITHHHQ